MLQGPDLLICCYAQRPHPGRVAGLIRTRSKLLFTVLCVLPGLLASVSMATEQAEVGQLQLLGWVENAWLVAPGFEVRAKLDTGANTSSLDAHIIKRFHKGGKRWVRFAVTNPETGDQTVLVRERKRTIGIVQHEGENDVRPTVAVEICIAGERRKIEVSLIDRSNFSYPLLLGRRVLKDLAVVHSGETFLSRAVCPENMEPGDAVLDHSVAAPGKGKS